MATVETISVGALTVLRAQPAVERHPPVLFVHGIFVDSREWAPWLPRFADRGFTACAVNLRGRAGSRPGTKLGSVSFDDYVTDAAEVARVLGRPSVVGHSMGGLIAQRLAALDLVRSAVLVTPAPPRGIPLFTPRLAMKQLKYLPAILTNGIIVPNADDLRELAMNRAPRDIQDVAVSQLVPDSGRVGRQLSLGVPVNASTVRCPMRVIAAEDDHFIPARVVAKIAQRYRARLDVYPEHGHIVQMEPGWEALADDVASWITAGARPYT
jgi:pimeloyl-ACP methyl ester carboxylesterase